MGDPAQLPCCQSSPEAECVNSCIQLAVPHNKLAVHVYEQPNPVVIMSVNIFILSTKVSINLVASAMANCMAMNNT